MVWWCPSVRPGLRPSVRPSVRHSFPHFFSYMLWHIDLKFCVSLYFYARKIKFECHQFPSLFAGVMLLLTSNSYKYAVFRTFLLHALTYWVQILYMTFVLMYHRSSLSVVILLQFLLELCLFVNFKILEIHSFPHFSLTCFFQVWVSSISVYFGVMPLFELRIL